MQLYRFINHFLIISYLQSYMYISNARTIAFGAELTFNNAAATGTVSGSLMNAVSDWGSGQYVGNGIYLFQKFGGLGYEISGSITTTGRLRDLFFYLVLFFSLLDSRC